MIDLYTWTTPNGRKASIMLEETGLPYTVHPIDIGKNDQFDEDFLNISPNNKIPAIVDQDNGMSLMESGAILIYLAEKTDMLMPKQNRWQILEWLMFQMGGFGPMLGQAHHFLHFKPEVSEYASKRYKVEAQRLYAVIDHQLEQSEYIAGDYSIADIALWPWASRFEWQQVDLDDFENVKRWYISIAERPAVQRGYDIPIRVGDIPMP
ncbi:MAG: glutathione S-transferase N-terminal domain-containing protein [Arenicellales bacterium]